MKINRTGFIIIAVSVLFLGLLVAVTIGGKDSKEHQFSRRLADFKAVLTPEVGKAFDAGKLDVVTAYLQDRIGEYQSYTNQFASDKRIDFLKARYQLLDKAQMQKVPKDLVVFYAKYFKVIDQECIVGFRAPEVVSYFKQYFADELEKMRKKVPIVELN